MHSIEYEGYKVGLDGVFSLYNITRIGPGKMPVQLQGGFTNTRSAQHAIDAYLSSREKNSANTSSLTGG